MSDEPDEQEEPEVDLFAHFSSEYAEALKAFETIQEQASTLMLLGAGDDLRHFLEQYIEMAQRTRASAIENEQQNFADWFAELVVRAEDLLAQIAIKQPPPSSH